MRLLDTVFSAALLLGASSFASASQKSPTQQNPAVSPPLPIIGLSSQYIRNSELSSNALLFRRGGPETCSEGNPCADGSCCSNNGVCGYGPTYCGNGNCTSNCDALAMCGIYSDNNGTIKCGMNLCCSHYGWCGTDEAHCGDPDPNGQAPCQDGFGLCEIVPPPPCGKTGSTNGRKIGYYQASNTRDRVCNKVSPSQINTTGYSHLYYAFAVFDPNSYQVVPASSDDVPLYTQFTSLKNSGLQTWIAIGGFDFSDNGTATHTAWSMMASTQGNRATFISSLMSFMSQYGFQGVDLDWEYPGTPERGGQRADTENFVSLVKEMRAAFGTTYGISLTLAPDYWYLRWFDAISMQDSVDWFGFMAYDLHGSWDTDVKTLGSIVRGQTDIRDISNDTVPLWFDGLDFSKINFGTAYYGRGYTLSDPSCNTLGCPFSGPSKPAPCTNFAGVMSSREIQNVITEQNLQPTLLTDSMMKQITWADQWIGYDDDETIAMKQTWADQFCFGGTMVWSVDFSVDNAGSGDTPPSSTDGTCGTNNGGTVCGNWPSGNCCSGSGYCGSGDSYCGNGCQSGDCIIGGVTTDGTCGVAHANSICGDWANGSCCSSSGYCGNTTAHCGDGCQSGPCEGVPTLGSGDVFISPEIFSEPDPSVACYPPCTFILPPWSLSTSTTISQPPVTITLEEIRSSSVTVTVVTTITIPPITTDIIPVSNVVWSNTSVGILYFWSSISFPPVVLTANTVTDTSGTTGTTTTPGGFVWTYSPEPGPRPTDSTTPPAPPPGFPPTIKPTPGPPGPKCKPGEVCGKICKENCVPKPHCIGICGCIGICPPGGGGGGPPGGPPCIGPGCSNPPGAPGGGGDQSGSSTCSITSTVSDCLDTCSETTFPGGSVSETCISSQCYATITGCDVVGTTTTTTMTDGCPLLPAYTPYWGSDTDMLASTLGGGGYGGFVVSAGTYTTPSGSSTSSSTTDIPTTTITTTIFPSPTTTTTFITVQPDPTTTTTFITVQPDPTETPTYDCKGSGECSLSTFQVKYCDHAVNYLERTDDLTYSTSGGDAQLTGNCWANSVGYGCGVFVQGTNKTLTGDQPCEFSGNQMWYDYQDIRNVGGCEKCGSKHYFNGCSITINYVSGCDNRT